MHTEMEEVVHERQQVSPVQSTAAGLAAFLGGKQIWGTSYNIPGHDASWLS